MTTEQARAKLILFYGVSDPTSREIALYVLYGDNAPFLQAKEQTQVVRWSSWGCYIVDDVRDKEGNDLCGRFLANIRATVLTESDGENV